jgi:hypothetical protein
MCGRETVVSLAFALLALAELGSPNYGNSNRLGQSGIVRKVVAGTMYGPYGGVGSRNFRAYRFLTIKVSPLGLLFSDPVDSFGLSKRDSPDAA